MISCVRSDVDTGPSKPSRRERPALRVVGVTSRVVIADSDAARRAGLLDDLTQTMPETTIFLEAATVTELLEHARGARMVILGGPLERVPVSSLIRILAQRHPELHVVNLETPSQTER
jgi:DNA-binding NarL/FixJ family response regulator